MHNYRKLGVYKEANELTIQLYNITSSFPREELYGLISQIRRAAASIGANIAEGAGRNSNKEFNKFLYMALGSLNEVEHFLCLSRELSYISNEQCEELLLKVTTLGGKFYNLINYFSTIY